MLELAAKHLELSICHEETRSSRSLYHLEMGSSDGSHSHVVYLNGFVRFGNVAELAEKFFRCEKLFTIRSSLSGADDLVIERCANPLRGCKCLEEVELKIDLARE